MERVLMQDCGDARRRADGGCFAKGPTAKTTSATLTKLDTGTWFTNRGAIAALTFTLPTAVKGIWYAFSRVAAFSVTLTAVGTAKIDGGSAAGSVVLQDGNGLVFLVCDGTDWFTVQTARDESIHYASVTLTNAQLKAVRATPITIVAAPGANKMIELVSGSAKLHAGANVLTESAANLALKFTNGAGAAVSSTIECTGFIDQAADTVTSITKLLDAIVAQAAAANQALVIHNTGAGEFGGNAAADATLTVKVAYRIVSIP